MSDVSPVKTKTKPFPRLMTGISIVPFLILAVSLQPWWRPLYANDFQRWVEAGVLVVVGMAVGAFLIWRGRPALGNVVTIGLLGIMLVFGVLNPFFSDVGWLSWVLVLRYGLWGLLFCVLLRSYPALSGRWRVRFAAAVLSVLCIYALYILVGLLTLLANAVNEAPFVVFSFSNVNHAAGFLMLTLLWLPALADRVVHKSVWAGRWALAAGAVLALLLFVIGSRGSFLAGFVALCAASLFRGASLRWYLLRLASYFGSGFALFAALQLVAWHLGILEALSLSSLTSDSGRYFLWITGLTGFLDAPIFGHGGLSYAALPDTMLGHPHNLIVQLLYEFGAPFTLALSAIILRAVIVVVRKREVVAMSVPAIAGCAVTVDFLVHSQFSGLTMIPVSVAVLVLALADGLAPALRHSTSTTLIRPASISVGVLVVAAALAYLAATTLYWNQNDDTLQKTRFWVNGGTEQWVQ